MKRSLFLITFLMLNLAIGNAIAIAGDYDGSYDIFLSNENGQYFTTENTPLKVVIYEKNWILFYDTNVLLIGNIVPTVRVLFFLNGTKIASIDGSSGKGKILNGDDINFK